MVGEGVRGRRVHRRLPGEAAAAGRGPARRALQRHPVGAPRHTRLVLRRRRDRPAHRRDAERPRHARLAAHPAGPPHLRGIERLGEIGLGFAGRSRAALARAHPPARRARGGTHARLQPQLRGQLVRRARLGDGLPGAGHHRACGQHARLLGRVRHRHRHLGHPAGALRLHAVRFARGGARRARGDPAREPRQGLHLHERCRYAARRRGAPARGDVGQRRGPGGGAGARADRAPDRVARVRRAERSRGHADEHTGRSARAALLPPSLPARGRGQVGGRARLRVCGARRRLAAGETCAGRERRHRSTIRRTASCSARTPRPRSMRWVPRAPRRR